LHAIRDDALISAVSVEEVLAGMREIERARTMTLLDGFAVIPITREEATIAGGWRREYATRGVTLNARDCLIAGCAVNARLPLATANVRDFPMPEVEVLHWPSE